MLDTSTGVIVMIALAVLIAMTLAIIVAFAMNPPDKTSTHQAAQRRRAQEQRTAARERAGQLTAEPGQGQQG